MNRKWVTSLMVLAVIGPAEMAWSGGRGIARVQIGADNNSGDNAFVQPGECETQDDGSLVCQDPAAAGGGRDQSLQFGDVLLGSRRDDVQIGSLGIDILAGGDGDDVQIGGLEHFFPQNRDRAFGGRGSDIFIWKPGDGSDFFAGGSGADAVVFGNVGEVVEGNSHEASFGVVADRVAGEVFLDKRTRLPRVDVSGSPGFCDVIDRSTSPKAKYELRELGIDKLVRFTIRGIAKSFEEGTQKTDNGLRVTLHLADVEYLVCTSRAGGEIDVLDLRWSPPRPIELEEIRSRKLRRRLGRMIF